MSTTTITGFSNTYDSDTDSIVSVDSNVELTVVGPDGTSFTYSVDDFSPDSLPLISVTDDAYAFYIDGQRIPDDVDVSLGLVTWGNGNQTVVLEINYAIPDTETDISFVFRLAGDPLPTIDTPADFNALSNSITNIQIAPSPYAPGDTIVWASLPSAQTTLDDLIIDGNDGNLIDGGAGDDTIFGNGGNDTLWGRDGEDELTGGPGDDILNGGPHFDEVHYENDPAGVTVNLSTRSATDGYGGSDILLFNEAVRGSLFADSLTGDEGENHFRGLDGDDVIDGHDGHDVVRYDKDADYGGTAGVTVDLADGFAIDGFGSTDTLRNIESARGSDFNDLLIGDAMANRLVGLAGDDELFGGGGEDTIEGGEGDDFVKGGGGADTIDGGAGDDYIYGQNGSDVINGGADNDTMIGNNGEDTMNGDAGNDSIKGGFNWDTIDGGAGDDTVLGQNGYDTVSGGLGDDSVLGNNGRDRLYGNAGEDTVLGGSGNDFMHGGPDNDTMMGGTGRDTIIGGFGDDVLTGDNGPDLFVFNPDVGTGDDTITDFEDGFDTILIAGSTEFSDLSIDEIDGNTVVSWEGGSVTLTDVTGVIDENDFTFS